MAFLQAHSASSAQGRLCSGTAGQGLDRCLHQVTCAVIIEDYSLSAAKLDLFADRYAAFMPSWKLSLGTNFY